MHLPSLVPLLFLPTTVLTYVVLPEADVFQVQADAEAKRLARYPPKILSSENPPPNSDDDDPLPVVIWHGLGDSADADGLKDIAALLDEIHPGTYVHIISLGKSEGSADRSSTFFGNVTEQVEQVCEQLATHNILSTAPAIDAIGFSQGGQFLRGYVERCGHWAPRIRSLITFGSQHNGIAEFQKCESATDWICHGANALLKSSTVWSQFVQNRLVPAQYYRPGETDDYENYLEYSNFLADVNNERESKNGSYAENLAELERMVLVVFKDDITVIPRESGWFSEIELVKEGDKEIRKVIELKDRKIYKEDWIGLRALDKKGGLVFEEVEGEHMQLKEKDLKRLFKKYFGKEGKIFDEEDDKWEL